MSRSPGLSFSQAVSLVELVCEVAGSKDLIREAQSTLSQAGVVEAVRQRNTAVIYDWLMDAVSYQGVSDQVAEVYMDAHGAPSYRAVYAGLGKQPQCSKLHSYWQFNGCGYRKNATSCNRQDLIHACPLPQQDLRNGSLNQAAYSLFLFMRDICDGDFVGWVDQRLSQAPVQERAGGLALLEPMRHVHGLSWKVLNMAMASFLLGADPKRMIWRYVGANMVAVDTLVHNWMHRTGILRGMRAEHPYGSACYSSYGCERIIRGVAAGIDARGVNPEYPKLFPRLIQHAVWRFCAQQQLDQCNGNRIDDRKRCGRFNCIAHSRCKRLRLSPGLPH